MAATKRKKLYGLKSIQEVMDNHINRALRVTENNVSQAAFEIDMHRRTLQRILARRARLRKRAARARAQRAKRRKRQGRSW
jgi:ActR/RegA family two-component response regulator